MATHGVLVCQHRLLEGLGVLGDIEEVGKISVAQNGPADTVARIQVYSLEKS